MFVRINTCTIIGTDGPEVASLEVVLRRRKGKNVEDRLKSLMQELGNAINESLSDSEHIAEAIGEIKRSGYDVFLVLEATIGFNKRGEDSSRFGEDEDVSGQPVVDGILSDEKIAKMRFTTQDHRFLKALRITVDEEV